jgi:glutamate racemase
VTKADARDPQDLHLLLTDSGLGGLAVCAGIERNLRASCRYRRVRLTYFNAAAEPRRGYNDLPDAAARAALLDRVLAAMEALHPDRIVLACNTLSVLYEGTAHARRHAARVTGIIGAGVGLFAEALAADPGGVLLLLGTRTTIDSGTHRQRLIARGLAADRIAAISCHGLAAAIDSDPDGPEVQRLIEQCAAALPGLRLAGRGERLYAGLACTHYGFVEQPIRAALQRASGLSVSLLDPNQALVDALTVPPDPDQERGDAAHRTCEVAVQVLSKVPLEEIARKAIARRIGAASDLTARALLSYTRDPDLF